MTVFKTFLKIVKKNKFVIIMYSCLLVLFGGINMSQNDNISLDNRYIMWYNYNTLVWSFSVPIVQKI